MVSTTPYRIVVTTCDPYLSALKPFYWLLEKYWAPPIPGVVVLGFTPPDFYLPENFSFYSVGRMQDYPISKWSDQLIDGLRLLNDEVFIFMLEDMWIIKPVDTRVVQMAYDYMIQFEYVARLDLTGDRLHAGGASFHGMLGDVKLIHSSPNSPYHLSTMPAFWRKEHLLRALVRGETPWQVEIQGTPRLSAMDKLVLGTEAWPLRNTLAFRGGETGTLLLDEIDPDDVKMMRAHGLLDGLE